MLPPCCDVNHQAPTLKLPCECDCHFDATGKRKSIGDYSIASYQILDVVRFVASLQGDCPHCEGTGAKLPPFNLWIRTSADFRFRCCFEGECPREATWHNRGIPRIMAVTHPDHRVLTVGYTGESYCDGHFVNMQLTSIMTIDLTGDNDDKNHLDTARPERDSVRR